MVSCRWRAAGCSRSSWVSGSISFPTHLLPLHVDICLPPPRVLTLTVSYCSRCWTVPNLCHSNKTRSEQKPKLSPLLLPKRLTLDTSPMTEKALDMPQVGSGCSHALTLQCSQFQCFCSFFLNNSHLDWSYPSKVARRTTSPPTWLFRNSTRRWLMWIFGTELPQVPSTVSGSSHPAGKHKGDGNWKSKGNWPRWVSETSASNALIKSSRKGPQEYPCR